ncbi:hypothetical protein, partial [uncultured Sphingomonas sp.]|uniref:hypothetical protein n=1 Tax=uncultured Sphingomonas sp. TaxID=158754 RepID=UPI0030FCEFDB
SEGVNSASVSDGSHESVQFCSIAVTGTIAARSGVSVIEKLLPGCGIAGAAGLNFDVGRTQRGLQA